jgi:hypothetical protein
MDVSAQRVAKNEAAFRDANERIEQAAGHMANLEPIPFICECARPECTEILRLPRDAYERVRSDRSTFWVVPGHEITEVDGTEVGRVIERHETYTVLEKFGESGETAAALANGDTTGG